MRALALLPLGLLVFLLPVRVPAQYLFLDANGDGIHDERDQLAPSGVTTVDIWIVTDRNRDGTPVSCDVAESGNGLTINSYTVVLHAAGGGVKFGPMQNRLPFTERPVCFATYEDTTTAGWYHNGWGWMDQFPPGKHLVATLPIEVTSGTPSIIVAPYLPRRVVELTAFGTSCAGQEYDNTYKLGLDWHDADGLGPLRADAGGPYQVQAGRTLEVNGTGSRLSSGAPMTYQWDFGDGGSGAGAIATHVYGTAGDYRLVLSVQGDTESDTDTTNVHVVPTQAPFARISGPTVAYVGVPVVFDASASYDPEGDPLTYRWSFGDGHTDVGYRVNHTYAVFGAKILTLVVDDGILTDMAVRQISVYEVGHAPVAVAGGPYSGIAGRLIAFDGTASSDPDGDPLQYSWTFGDRSTGTGPVPSHAYDAPGVYTVHLTISDGGLTSAVSATTATVAEFFPARAFAEGPATFTRGQSTPMTVHLEPVDMSFIVQDIEPWPVLLRASGAGTVGEISCVADATITPDSDGDNRAELTFTFGPEELALLFGGAPAGSMVDARVRGTFFTGGYFEADLPVQIGSPEVAAGRLRISPNPFNPEALVNFSTSKAGPVLAHLFDVRGHLVRTIQYGSLDAGRHVVTLAARTGTGSPLASGIYFFRLTSADGVVTRRVAVAK